LAVAAVLSLYFIWADVLPALRLLDRVQIWPETRVVERLDREVDPILRAAAQSDTMRAAEPESVSQAPAPNEAAADPASSADGLIDPLTGTIAQPESIGADSGERPPRATTNFVSLADIGLALIVIAATAIAFRNLPGFIEIVILQRLPLDPGSRYALSTVLRYTIAIVGIIVAFQLVGFTWNKVQWLAAALTFGLAFGLQEIFANFVSGLIILGERPVRVGDTVTVGTVTGTVTRIRMRATTITDWDRKELIIPNKNFITGDVINWTLSDPILRVIVPVGVSYGSDIDKVTNLLSRIAQESEIVLAEPKPRALFLGFGDSTLNFEVRVFIPHIDYLLAVRHELHMTIMKRFREANIEIAFPQRDLHVRSIGDLAMFAQKREDLPPEEQR
jgi:potassium efflux system protein